MTKKVYTKPELKSEAFVPQTHVAACGDSGTVYKFTVMHQEERCIILEISLLLVHTPL